MEWGHDRGLDDVASVSMRAKNIVAVILISVLGGWAIAAAQQGDAEMGPTISDYGPVFDVSKPDFETPLDLDYKVVFDVASASSDASRPSPSIATVARFLNMHARAGVDPGRIHAALVLHGGAAKYALVDAAYRRRFGNDNPNRDLLEQLRSAGVRIVLCGQTAVSSGFEREEIAAPVEVALSAMTALVTLQRDGYALIP